MSEIGYTDEVTPSLRRVAVAAIGRGVIFLCNGQDREGAWHDYNLPKVGCSDAWTTSYVGSTLTRIESARSAVRKARIRIRMLRRPEGWGYNETTPCDCDSTAWAVLFARPRGARGLIERYLEDDGQAHTYVEPHFGTWTGLHADVTPVTGRALNAIGAGRSAIRRTREACLAGRGPDGLWSSFWWINQSYALGQNLDFLFASGGVPPAIAEDARLKIRSAEPTSAFDAAHLLLAARRSGLPAASLIANVLDRQVGDGSWPPSAALLLRGQRDGSRGDPYEDGNRFISTASAVYALSVASTGASFLMNARGIKWRR